MARSHHVDAWLSLASLQLRRPSARLPGCHLCLSPPLTLNQPPLHALPSFLIQTIVTGAGDETLRFWTVFPPAKPQVSPLDADARTHARTQAGTQARTHACTQARTHARTHWMACICSLTHVRSHHTLHMHTGSHACTARSRLACHLSAHPCHVAERILFPACLSPSCTLLLMSECPSSPLPAPDQAPSSKHSLSGSERSGIR